MDLYMIERDGLHVFVCMCATEREVVRNTHTRLVFIPNSTSYFRLPLDLIYYFSFQYNYSSEFFFCVIDQLLPVQKRSQVNWSYNRGAESLCILGQNAVLFAMQEFKTKITTFSHAYTHVQLIVVKKPQAICS